MARSSTPSKKRSKSSSGPIDLNDPMINLGVTVVTLVLLGCIGPLNGEEDEPFGFDHITDGEDKFGAIFRIFGGDAVHATYWPYALMTTLHLINSVGSNGGYWANDIIGCVFTAFGGLMMQDFLGNVAVGEWQFWAHMPITVLLWYIVNHNIPKTEFNVWSLISENVAKVVPLQRVMDLATLSFNVNLLLAVAGAQGTAANSFYGLPDFSKAMFMCVAIHCSGDFFSQGGFDFSISGCSAACERAVIVCFWMTTNGMATLLPALGNGTAQISGVFGGNAQFLWAMILINELAGDMIPVKPHRLIMDFLNDTLGL